MDTPAKRAMLSNALPLSYTLHRGTLAGRQHRVLVRGAGWGPCVEQKLHRIASVGICGEQLQGWGAISTTLCLSCLDHRVCGLLCGLCLLEVIKVLPLPWLSTTGLNSTVGAGSQMDHLKKQNERKKRKMGRRDRKKGTSSPLSSTEDAEDKNVTLHSSAPQNS